MGIASGLVAPFPDRDDVWVLGFDNKWKDERDLKELKEQCEEGDSYKDTFIKYMNFYRFDQ